MKTFSIISLLTLGVIGVSVTGKIQPAHGQDYDYPCPPGWGCTYGKAHDANLREGEILVHGFIYAKDEKKWKPDKHQLGFSNASFLHSLLNQKPITALESFTCLGNIMGEINSRISKINERNRNGDEGVLLTGKGGMRSGSCSSTAKYLKGKSFECQAYPGHRAGGGWRFTDGKDEVKFRIFVTVGPTGLQGGRAALDSSCLEY